MRARLAWFIVIGKCIWEYFRKDLSRPSTLFLLLGLLNTPSFRFKLSVNIVPVLNLVPFVINLVLVEYWHLQMKRLFIYRTFLIWELTNNTSNFVEIFFKATYFRDGSLHLGQRILILVLPTHTNECEYKNHRHITLVGFKPMYFAIL